MQLPKLYTPENVERAKYAQIGVGIVAAALCAYMGFSALRGVRQVWQAERTLSQMTLRSGKLSREAASLRKQEESQPPMSRGGVESFALQLSRWAKEKNVDVESFAPEGSPTASEVKMEDTKLGTWNAHKVRVEGRGDFRRVMSLLQELRDPHLPVQMESVAFQRADAGVDGVISFNLLCTIYERKSKSG